MFLHLTPYSWIIYIKIYQINFNLFSTKVRISFIHSKSVSIIKVKRFGFSVNNLIMLLTYYINKKFKFIHSELCYFVLHSLKLVLPC